MLEFETLLAPSFPIRVPGPCLPLFNMIAPYSVCKIPCGLPLGEQLLLKHAIVFEPMKQWYPLRV